MAYDETLADRIRDSIPDAAGLTETRMFGGLAFPVPDPEVALAPNPGATPSALSVSEGAP